MKSVLLKLIVPLWTFGVIAAQGQNPSPRDYTFREFTGANGKKIKAVILDKSETELKLLLPTGATTVITFEKLSEEDQEYAKNWDKGKDVFIRKCQSLTLRELLELRGYESFAFRLQNNEIIVKGEVNGQEGDFMISTGSNYSTMHIGFAEKAEVEVGPLDQKMMTLAGEIDAGIAPVGEIRLGESIIKDQELMATDLKPEEFGTTDVIFGAEFLRKLAAVISYKENRIFFRPDLAGDEGFFDGAAAFFNEPEFRIFKMDDGKAYKGNVVKKTGSAATIKLVDGKEIQVPVSRFSLEDEEYVLKWSEAGAAFLKDCRGLTVEDLLELRDFESFVYSRQNNQIFVDGKINELDTVFKISTGSNTTLLHIDAAKAANCTIGPMKEQGLKTLAGWVPAAVAEVGSFTFGDAVISNRSHLTADLFPQSEAFYGATFGADFLTELQGVVTYRENRIFLYQDK